MLWPMPPSGRILGRPSSVGAGALLGRPDSVVSKRRLRLARSPGYGRELAEFLVGLVRPFGARDHPDLERAYLLHVVLLRLRLEPAALSLLGLPDSPATTYSVYFSFLQTYRLPRPPLLARI